MFKIFLLCLGLHFFADYTLQGWLAQAKCTAWWEKNAPDPLYRCDWSCALLCHAVYWTLVTYAPLIWLWPGHTAKLAVLLFLNIIAHCAIDDLKANRHHINLWHDQALHVLQIAMTMLPLAALLH